MYLVGVISENKQILKILEKDKNIKKVDFINLDLKTIENFKNIKFDVILISNLKNYNKNNNFKKILSNSSISLINTDIKDNLKNVNNLKGIVITYGFNSKSTVTVSSVENDKISICLQRVIKNIDGENIEPIEYVESMDDVKNIDISDVIGIKAMKKILLKKKN